MAWTIALNFEDGVSRFISCGENEKVLDAAYRQKINLPMDCSDGVCGTCKCRCESGGYALGDDYLEDALSEQENAQGMVLTCQMIPTSDCVISVPVSSGMCKTASEHFQADITHVVALSDSAIELRLNLDSQTGIGFLPGQYVNIRLPDSDATRAYSFSSLPGDNAVSFLIRNVPDGLMSNYLARRAKPGDRLSLSGPFGSFYLRAVQRPVLMLAGGTGLAPFLSMLHSLQQTPPDYPIHLVYGVTHDSDAVKLPQLDEFARTIPNFNYRLCVADPASGSARKGYVTEHLDDVMLNAGDVDVYLCGPPPMVDAVMGFFTARSLTPHGFYYEKFTPQAIAEAC
ncbi:benzoate 1,2-dioxygenase electron transfer component BenC [Citrobacter portucalensis]|uniref:benzoate 1,2-dioxygenase electron transfer component BenC n=1 Tax=Citrobacter portucalensis TaxID=1639133 RepID=UPI0015801B3C|nr:benzoate 1,2-dioxygenase electron transfer component BenC [Citrobacter portucalensis]MBW7621113.1 ring-hydroxylating dioxygenase ferredoxin reductase family protein [Citrobacter portucalensis]MBW7640102.1 ring-hydroxylating dioxygenase ferredoxin reductase family protein [Citrobacter portucalensis]MCA2134730.1 ring-hydroxylating dioxygenase ferredoxin reductase family protein [Citrobacter portucalensis]MCA2144903.1 ring-hydroxylating dioxygenase ferredoxin reductase family protein [Citrobact